MSGPSENIDAPEPPSFVPAYLVDEQPPPKVRKTIRFGIGSLFVCMTVFAFQFTMIRYGGLLGAIALPPLIICFMVLSAIYLEIRWKGISNRQRRESLSNMLTNRSFLYLFVLGVSGYVLGSATSYYKFIPKSSIKNELESDLGFRSTKTYAGSPGSHRELLEIDRVQAGSVMNRAGLKKGDLIVVPSPVDEFFRQLNGKRGSTINLTIQRGQSTSQKRLEENKQFSVKIQIPD